MCDVIRVFASIHTGGGVGVTLCVLINFVGVHDQVEARLHSGGRALGSVRVTTIHSMALVWVSTLQKKIRIYMTFVSSDCQDTTTTFNIGQLFCKLLSTEAFQQLWFAQIRLMTILTPNKTNKSKRHLLFEEYLLVF